MIIFGREFGGKVSDTSAAYVPQIDMKYTLTLEPEDLTPKQGMSMVSVDDLDPFAQSFGQAPSQHSFFDGDKFGGGFGITQLQITDYWTLRQRSSQLFNENLYARGLVRRLVTNEINTGLTPEASPDEQILGVPEDSLNDWTEMVENRFGIWSKNPKICDWKQQNTFGEIQRTARREALVSGDVLVISRQSQRTKLPTIQLVSGNKVRTPLASETSTKKGHKIVHGVEFNTVNRIVAHWIVQDDNTTKRIPAFGEKTGRRISWLIYGTDKRLDEVRGQPLLSIVLQSLKEIDRYRDSTQRKAVINSIVAMFIKKTVDKPGTLPMTGGAVRRDQASVTDGDGKKRTFNVANYLPGMVIDELQEGEEPVLKGGEGTDLNFGVFEEAVLQSIAWANEIPPEILRLAFSNNYSASQAAINEFKIYLNMRWSIEGDTFTGPIYQEWLLSETLLGKIKAPGLLEAWRNPQLYDIFGAWVCADWYGSIKPSTDMLKQVKASDLLVEGGYSTRAREARVTTGTKFSKNVKRLKRENEQLAEALEPLLELKQKLVDMKQSNSVVALDDAVEEITSRIEEINCA